METLRNAQLVHVGYHAFLRFLLPRTATFLEVVFETHAPSRQRGLFS